MALSVVLFYVWENRKTNNAESKSEKILSKADRKRDHIVNDARRDADATVNEAKQEAHDIMKKAQHTEDRIAKTEARIIEREEKIEQRLDQIGKRQDDLLAQEENIKSQRDELERKRIELDGKLSEIAKLTEAQAKELYMNQIGGKYEKDAISLVEKHKKKIEKQKIEISREILLKSIQQYAGDVTSEVTTTIIPIPSDDIKGKLIGKEGRNITTFEKNA
jgi:ribonuclease Y